MKMRRSNSGVAVLTSSALALLAAMTMPASAEEGARTDFDLICSGSGEHLASHDTYGYEWDREKHKYVQHDGVQYNREQMQATFQVEIHDGEGRIRPPKSIAPPLSSGSNGGWWQLHDLSITPDRIQGSFKFNGMNVPKISIDRRSGFMTMKGSETFEGTCTAVEPDQNRF
ncbi:hypothetical protein [Stenotrophomonas rhizophila]|uniref:Secreted protein n=1 Tax=Stenotrophomonas rhizophila TaxID=216778 RepID=A0AAW5PF31_9GAMM|nr:hypothetical protein [Stenotrophomonas rhizophila]MCS4279013.1 hypothetical protein [Stenotrophomonas rhizophila]